MSIVLNIYNQICILNLFEEHFINERIVKPSNSLFVVALSPIHFLSSAAQAAE